jgi:probable rRNA maturation factor
MKSNKLVIDVAQNSSWNEMVKVSEWMDLLDSVLDRVISAKYNDTIVGVRLNLHLIDDQEMSELNAKYMGKSGSTNVLSFPLFSDDELSVSFLQTHVNTIGDVFLANGRITREATEFNIPFFERCTHLFIHGVLHLLGMDHASDQEEKEMENLEICVLESFGISNPYGFS